MSKEKRITVNQAVKIVHDYYDELERSSLIALKEALHTQFGFGDKRYKRVQDAYLDRLGEEFEKRMGEIRKQMMRRIG